MAESFRKALWVNGFASHQIENKAPVGSLLAKSRDHMNNTDKQPADSGNHNTGAGTDGQARDFPLPHGRAAEKLVRQLVPLLRQLTKSESPMVGEREANFLIKILGTAEFHSDDINYLPYMLESKIEHASVEAEQHGIDRILLSGWLGTLSNSNAFLLYAATAIHSAVAPTASDFLCLSQETDSSPRHSED